MNGDLINRAREGRKSPATLKIKLSNLRSRYTEDPIFIVEGVDDVGVYETWIQGYISDKFIQIIPGNGKEQLLGLRSMLKNDTTGLANNTFFFVDHDYDGLKQQQPGPDIFCLDHYSTENYLSSIKVIKSILRDELRLDPLSPDFQKITSLFEKSLDSFLNHIREINFHIYCCRKLKIKLKQQIPQATDFLSISIDKVSFIGDPVSILNTQFPTENQISEEDRQKLILDFNKLDPLKNHRGKFFYEFTRKWLHCLSDEISLQEKSTHIQNKISTKFSPAHINHRSCATRSDRPLGLKNHLERIYH